MNIDEVKRNIKAISYITTLIISFMIIICSVFLISPLNSPNSFELDNSTIKYVKGEGVIVEGSDKVKVYNTVTEKVEELNLEEYLIGVVAAEMPASFNEEAIKAQSIAARTYYFSKRLSNCKVASEHGAEICSSTHCQAYMTKEERMSKWESNKGEEFWNKISDAVNSTKGEVMVYDDDIVRYPQFFSTSSGKTENSIEVFSGDIPYLKSVDSPGEEGANKYSSIKELEVEKFVETINKSYSKSGVNKNNINEKVKIISRTEGGSVKEISLGSEKITGVEFRKLFELNSANFTLEYSNGVVKVNCKGYGHGVGMSQYGADSMGKNGKKYNEILKHYYSGIDIEKVIYK